MKTDSATDLEWVNRSHMNPSMLILNCQNGDLICLFIYLKIHEGAEPNSWPAGERTGPWEGVPASHYFWRREMWGKSEWSLQEDCVYVFFSYSQIFHEDICFSVLGSIYRSAGCCQMCSEGSVHQAKVHGPVAAELLQNHCSLPAGAEWETPRLRYLWGRDPRNHSHCKYECPHLHHCSCIILYCNLN